MKSSVKYSGKEGMEEYNETNEKAWRESIESQGVEDAQIDTVIELWKDGLILLIVEV